jgi:DNA-binding protein HU-beta
MKKEEMIQSLAGKLGESKAATERILSAVLQTIEEGLVGDGVVQITGFGSFRVRSRGPRMGRNPRTGESIQLAGSKSVGFKVGKALKDAIQ